jgi:starch-binding outer membrane protein, SusD/RagB family
MKMKNIKQYFKLLLFIAILLTSCNKDSLNLEPLTAYSDVAVWSDPILAETFLNGIYFKMEHPNGDNKYGTPNYCDELNRRNGGAQNNFNNCIITPDQMNWRTELPSWDNLYVIIRSCNKFIENAGKLPDDGTLTDGVTKINRMIGEAHFLRAWFYMRLTSLYGGVPIVDKAYQLTDDFLVPRNSYEECVNFMVDDCDLAASLLPLQNSTDRFARATKGAALALKSRILIYAASDLHNTNVFPDYANPELIGYTNADRAARFQAAKDAAKAVMDLNLYSLFRPDPAPGDSVSQNFVDLFNSKDCEEDIMVRYATPTSYDVNYSWMNLSGPNGYHGRGSNAPLDNLARDYERKDGTKFDWNNPVHAAEPYKYRDPRFYATIFYEGAKWRTRASGEYPLDPVGVIQVGMWQRWNAETNSMVEVWGLDTRKGPNSPFEGGYTGYYIRKYFDPAVDAQFFVPDIGWRYFRYAEILLNYAEACIGLGQDDEAKTYINIVRKRAGMPDITETGIALRDRYRNERRVELAVEEHRFYDIRRWLIGPQSYVAAYKVNVVYPMDPVTHETATVPTITPAVHVSYAWIDKAYFLPILRTEMNKNSKLIQNPGYE